MIITEYYSTRADGVILNRTYSDSGMMIRQDGTDALYAEAIDPDDAGRTYTETDTPIPDEELTAEEALEIILNEEHATWKSE